jgi:hypothetical protein
MRKNTRYLGLDGHEETITAAGAAKQGAPESLVLFRNSPESVRKFFDNLGDPRLLWAIVWAAARTPANRRGYWEARSDAYLVS